VRPTSLRAASQAAPSTGAPSHAAPVRPFAKVAKKRKRKLSLRASYGGAKRRSANGGEAEEGAEGKKGTARRAKRDRRH
jgi:hypothetical protein